MTQEVVEQQETAAAPAVEQEQVATEAQAEVKAEPAAQEQEAKDERERDERGRFKPTLQQRIDELTRARHEAEREATYWKQRAEPPAKEPAQEAKPTPDKFTDYADYVEALTEWKADQKVNEALAKRDQQQAEKAQQSVQETKAKTFVERQATVRQSIPDYDEVMTAAADIRVAQHVHEVLLDSDRGPELAYHLAKNPDEAARISALSPLAAARELGRLEASLEKPATASKPVSKAPAPIKPIVTGATSTQDPSRMSMDEYRSWRKSQGASWAR